MYLILGETYFDSNSDAVAGPLPAIPLSLENYAINMAYIIASSGITSLSGHIYDIRPLPYQYRIGGQAGSGTEVTTHSELLGLENDDHPQYLRTNGTRDLTGIQSYQSHPTFTTDTALVDKKYVDDGLETKTDITTFNTFTGTTLPANYYDKTEINSYTGETDTRLTNIESDISYISGVTDNKLNISTFDTYTGNTEITITNIENDINYISGVTNTKLNISTFDTYTGNTDTRLNGIENDITYISGVTNTKLNETTFNTFTGTTLPNNYYNKTEINSYTAQTQTEINNRLLISDFNYYTGTTAPNTYVTITDFNSYTADTQNILDGKADLTGATFTGEVRGVTPAINDNSTCFATTEYYVNQAANTNPLMDGTVAIGTSLRFARQDHVHPTDTSRFAVTGGTITGSVNITGDLGVSGQTILSGATVGSNLAKYDADYSGTYDNRTLVDKEFVDTHPLAYSATTNTGDATTTSTTDVVLTGMQLTNVPAGTYMLSFGTSLSHNTSGALIYTSIYVGGTQIANSELPWSRPNQSIITEHGLNNYVITLATTQTVEIRWRTTTGTATSENNRYLTLLKISSLV